VATHAVDHAFDAEVRTADDAAAPLTVPLAGVVVRVVDSPATGALVMFARRVDSKNPLEQISAVVRLLEQWIVPEDHGLLWDAIELVHDVPAFLEGDVARFIEQVSARPTSAPSS
jgi:hypothetical protein